MFDDEVWMSASYGVELNLKNSFMDTQNELEAWKTLKATNNTSPSQEAINCLFLSLSLKHKTQKTKGQQ